MTKQIPNQDKFTWKEGDITFILPTGQLEMLTLVQSISDVDSLQRALPRIEGWMREHPDDTSVASALIEVMGEF